MRGRIIVAALVTALLAGTAVAQVHDDRDQQTEEKVAETKRAEKAAARAPARSAATCSICA